MEFPAITDRQIQILKHLIQEYIASGEAIGSETLDKRCNLGVSPATIRNEMVILTQQGYLTQLHTSSGRIPTPMAMRFYITNLMQEKDLSVAEEVSYKSKIWDSKDEVDTLLNQATKVLAENVKTIAITVTEQGNIYHSGYANILDIPEFFDIDVTRTVFSLIDDSENLIKYFSSPYGEEPIHVLLGDDFDTEFMYPCGLLYADIDLNQYGKARLGVLGPSRLDYETIIPTLRYFSRIINEISQTWK